MFRKTIRSLRKYGLCETLRRGWAFFIRKIKIIKSRLLAFPKFLSWYFQWFLSTPANIIGTYQRVLLIWDFRSQPFSIGDLILLQEVGEILRQQQSAQVDICWLTDPKNPARESFAALGVNSTNYIEKVISLIPIAFLGKNIGEFHIFNSHSCCLKFLSNRISQDLIWPTGKLFFAQEDLNFHAFSICVDFFRNKGYIPTLQIRPDLEEWGKQILANINSPVKIVVHIRNAADYNPSRNSQIDVWSEFFKICKGKYQAVFVIVCSWREIDKRLCGENVVFSKDFFTNSAQDMALISVSDGFLGVSSGPSTIAFFGENPYRIFNAHIDGLPSDFFVKAPTGLRFIFSKDHQRLFTDSENLDLLLSEFASMYEEILLRKAMKMNLNSSALSSVATHMPTDHLRLW